MKNKGIKYKLRIQNGIYDFDTPITIENWLNIIDSNEIFIDKYKDFILYWYFQEDYKSSAKYIQVKYLNYLKGGTPFNGYVKKLANQIHQFLNYTFWLEQEEKESESFWPLIFKG